MGVKTEKLQWAVYFMIITVYIDFLLFLSFIYRF